MRVALVDGDLVDPGQQGTAAVEALDGEIDFGEDLLGDVFGVLTIPQDSIDSRKNSVLMALNDVAKTVLIARLSAPHELEFLSPMPVVQWFLGVHPVRLS
jgi:hypothetical protein